MSTVDAMWAECWPSPPSPPRITHTPRRPVPAPSQQRRNDLAVPFDVTPPIVPVYSARDIVPSYHLKDRGASRAREREYLAWTVLYQNMLFDLAGPARWVPPPTRSPPSSAWEWASDQSTRFPFGDSDDGPALPATSFNASVDLGAPDILPARRRGLRARLARALQLVGAPVLFSVQGPTLTRAPAPEPEANTNAERRPASPVSTASPPSSLVDDRDRPHVEQAFWDRVAAGEMGYTRPETVRTPADMAAYADHLNDVERRKAMYVERGFYRPQDEPGYAGPCTGTYYVSVSPARSPARSLVEVVEVVEAGAAGNDTGNKRCVVM